MVFSCVSFESNSNFLYFALWLVDNQKSRYFLSQGGTKSKPITTCTTHFPAFGSSYMQLHRILIGSGWIQVFDGVIFKYSLIDQPNTISTANQSTFDDLTGVGRLRQVVVCGAMQGLSSWSPWWVLLCTCVISGYISTEMVQQSCSQLNTLPSKIKRKDNSKLLYCIEAVRKNNANYPLLRRKC